MNHHDCAQLSWFNPGKHEQSDWMPFPWDPCKEYLPTFTADLPQKSIIHVGKYTIPMDPMGLEWSFLEDSDDAEDAEDVTLHEPPEPPEPMEPVRHTELAEFPGGYHFLENISCRLPIKNKVNL